MDLFGGGQGDWDPREAQLVSPFKTLVKFDDTRASLTFQIKGTAIGIAVFSFYCLDFALNG